MSKAAGANDVEKLNNLCGLTYKEQAVWFLNAFWDSHSAEAERLWEFVHKFAQLDNAKKAQGNALDELNSHRFLEKLGETLTVQSLREKLRSTGAITDRPKVVPLLHYLLFRYGVSFHELVNAPQGDKAEVEKAQQMLDQVQAAFADASAREEAAKKSEAEAKASEAEAKSREDEARTAQNELEAALAELKAQEDAFNERTRQLQAASTTGGVVSQNKAKNELAQHLGSDPLPLRKAKITQEAAVKKAEKATLAASQARAEAERTRGEAEKARAEAEKARAEAEAAVEEARNKLTEAEAYFEKVKNSGVPRGAVWWMERELHEARAYLPASKGGYKKSA